MSCYCLTHSAPFGCESSSVSMMAEEVVYRILAGCCSDEIPEQFQVALLATLFHRNRPANLPPSGDHLQRTQSFNKLSFKHFHPSQVLTMNEIITTPRLKLTLVTSAPLGSPEFNWIHELRSNEQSSWWRYTNITSLSSLCDLSLTTSQSLRPVQNDPRHRKSPPNRPRCTTQQRRSQNLGLRLRRARTPRLRLAFHRPNHPPQLN
jgi:hypothetical protein